MQERENLRQKHGNEFDEFERIVTELDHLSAELHRVSEHAVNLDANFSKYGYSAALRTLPRSGNTSSAASTLGEEYYDHEHQHHDWDAERKQGKQMMFWTVPVMRQYAPCRKRFHQLWF
jgi:conjugal transfer/entry exclusion protein